MSPQLELVLPPPGPRRCQWCKKKMPKRARKDARTCGKACRQAKSRAARAEVSCDAVSLRRNDARILSRAAVERSGVATVASELLSAERVRPPATHLKRRLKRARAVPPA